jgi:hypothetical protein
MFESWENFNYKILLENTQIYKNEYGPIDINVKHGDIYIMSEKASGFDWLKSKRYRLVHAAGSIKYIG